MVSAGPAAASDVRRRLVEEAARILAEEGPAALSARRVAGGAGTSTMAVYTHFGAMSALVDEVATEGLRRLVAHVDAVDPSDDPLADLVRMAAAYRANALENRHLYGVMFGAVHLAGLGGRGPDPDVSSTAFGQLVDAVERAMAAGVLRADDATAVATQFWSALHGYVMLELAGIVPVPGDPDLTAEDAVLWPMLRNLLAALG